MTDTDAGRNLVHAADHNLRITLEAIRRGGPKARAELARLTGLSEPGVGNILRQLAASGLVRGSERTGRATGFGLAEAGAFSLGVDLSGGEGASAVLVDLSGAVHLRCDPVLASAEAVYAFAGEILAFLGNRRDRLAGFGIARGEEIEPDLLGAFEAAFAPAPISVASDAASAALGELHFGASRETDFAQLLIGRTIRVGFVIRGRLFEGVRGRAGRLGRMRIATGGRTLDEVAGTGALPAYRAPDAVFDGWLDRVAPPLLDAVVAMAGFLAPSTVFVGGDLSQACRDMVAERLTRGAAGRLDHPLQPNWLPRIVPATLGRYEIAMGAAALPFFNRLLPDPRRAG